jgi:hypothetical protein
MGLQKAGWKHPEAHRKVNPDLFGQVQRAVRPSLIQAKSPFLE